MGCVIGVVLVCSTRVESFSHGSSASAARMRAVRHVVRMDVAPMIDQSALFSPLMLPVIGPFLHAKLGVAGDCINAVLPVLAIAQVPKLLDIGKKRARASHVLVGPADEAKLVSAKLQIESGSISFEDAARELSKCPSGQRGGDLGEFKQGAMVPEFDAVVFSDASPIGAVLGPIRTQFGWHIIKVAERSS